MLGPREHGKAARKLLAALAEEIERLDTENAALVKEVEGLREDFLSAAPVSPRHSISHRSLSSDVHPMHPGHTISHRSLSSEVHPMLTYAASIASVPMICKRHLGPQPPDTSQEEKAAGGAELTPSPAQHEVLATRPRRSKNNDPAEDARLSRFMKMNSELNLMEERYENFYELSRAFHSLCAKHKITIGASEVVEMSLWQMGRGSVGEEPSVGSSDDQSEGEERLFRKVIVELNKDLPVAKKKRNPPQEVMLETYSLLMSGNKAEFKLEQSGQTPELIKAVARMRDILLKEDTIRKIAVATNTEVPDVYLPSSPKIVQSRTQKMVGYLDPFIGFVIVCNAIIIGVSTDWYQDDPVWDWCELIFTLIFILELTVKIRAFGFAKHFCGHDMWWNIFDLMVVIVAVIDVIFTLFGRLLELGNFTLVRLLRFARLTKLVRVLKLKMFKELALLVNGCLAGFRTLFWAVVFLAFILFALGVVVSDMFGAPDKIHYPNCPDPDGSDEHSSDQTLSDCAKSAAHLDMFRKQMFGNVPRSMFTIFRCFTDGCVAPDGTPLMSSFYNTHGLYIVLIYMVCMLFVMFGLFNLIMAVFVENTIENAKHDDARRREARTHEHIRVARKLQEVIMMFCTGENEWQVAESEVGCSSGAWFRNFFSTAWSIRDSGYGPTTNLSLKVTHDSFHKILQKPEVKQLLDDLDIGYSSRGALFEVLDANCNGVLEVHELVQGLLKMRGAAEKGDIIAALLAIRSLQRSMKAIELLGLKQQGAIDTTNSGQEQLQAEVRRLSRAVHSGLSKEADGGFPI